MRYLSATLKILGHRWEVRYCTPRYFRKHRTGPGDAAVTDGDARRIYFLHDQVSRMVAIHELTHAYFFEMGNSSSELKKRQLEEVFCEMLGRHGRRILRQARKIVREHQRLTTS